jgi:UDP-N-acetylglucosamine acyltransferase
VVGNDVIFSNNGTLAGHVTVEDHVVLGGFTAVHQYCRIGKFVMTGGCSKIVQDAPPFMLADGNPARVRGHNKVGLERHRFSEEQIRHVKEAYRLLYRSDLSVRQALERLSAFAASEEIRMIIDFVESSPRGIIK